jgi:protein-disulfide isomerase
MMMKKLSHRALALLAFMALATASPAGLADAKTAARAAPATAGDAPAGASSTALDAPSPDAINTLRLFKSQGAEIHYLGRLYGLDGWLVIKDKIVQIVYTTLDGQGTLVGVLYGPTGEMETSKQVTAVQQAGVKIPDMNAAAGTTPPAAAPGAAAAQPATTGQPPAAGPADSGAAQAPASERLLHDVENSTYVKFGPDEAPPLYVFMDPRCHFCHGYWESLVPLLQANTFQLRVIPVGILGPDSVQQAERVISAPNAVDAWTKLETGDPVALANVMAIQPAADSTQKLQANNDLMTRWKMGGTPYSVYRGKDGKVKLVYAVPNDVAQVVADLGK